MTRASCAITLTLQPPEETTVPNKLLPLSLSLSLKRRAVQLESEYILIKVVFLPVRINCNHSYCIQLQNSVFFLSFLAYFFLWDFFFNFFLSLFLTLLLTKSVFFSLLKWKFSSLRGLWEISDCFSPCENLSFIRSLSQKQTQLNPGSEKQLNSQRKTSYLCFSL